MNPIQIVVGTTPGLVDGTSEYVNTDWAGMAGYISKSGYGTYDYSNYQLLSGGGFRLLNGFKFNQDDVWFFTPTGTQYNVTAGNYTNGFDFNKVMNVMFSRIGFRQPTQAGYSSLLNTLNTTSTSGRYFNDFHAACDAYLLYQTQGDKDMGTTGYNLYLESWKKGIIMRALTAVFSAPEYIEQVLLYDRKIANTVEEPISNEGKFVGYAINISSCFDKAVQLNAVTLLFDTDKTFTLYLFKEGKKSAIWSKSVSVVANEATVVTVDDLVLNYIGDQVKGTRYYLGYFQNDLGDAKAINEDSVCWSKTLCFGARPFSAPATGEDLDRRNVSEDSKTFGLNLEMSSFKDWTQIIVKRPNLFDELIGLTAASQVIEQIIYSIRSNQEQRELLQGLQLASLISDLNGVAPVSDGPPPIVGLNKRIEREVKRCKDGVLPNVRSQIVETC